MTKAMDRRTSFEAKNNSSNLSRRTDKKIRLQVFLSRSGVCSRRRAMELIQDGKVSVNGQVVKEPSYGTSESDKVSFLGKPVTKKEFDYVLLNKPVDVTTTLKDPFAKKTVIDILPQNLKHLNPVGRLDKNTEGLLFLTNDGDLAHKLTHPKFNIDKVYFVTISKPLKTKDKIRLEKGIILEGKKTFPCRIDDIRSIQGEISLRMTIHEGRKRQIRLMFSALRYKVIYLRREKQGPLILGSLKTGAWRKLTSKELESLKSL
ncbi:MAG: pseudouridine synthase [Candidatus Aceula meridiana]|nr:pseudouridine synthase [Candidatus Aceula meridiana]